MTYGIKHFEKAILNAPWFEGSTDPIDNLMLLLGVATAEEIIDSGPEYVDVLAEVFDPVLGGGAIWAYDYGWYHATDLPENTRGDEPTNIQWAFDQHVGEFYLLGMKHRKEHDDATE